MSLINLFVAARNALREWRRRQRAYHELMALDDRSLADIGIHRSQISAIVEGARLAVASASDAAPAKASAMRPSDAWLAAGHR
jgi:uncharacterized protein YjiS (DUF1127 family)